MKICPKCKNEYRDGITYCADCDCELVDAEQEQQESVLLVQLPEAEALKLAEYLTYSQLSSVTCETAEEGMTELYCAAKEYEIALKQVKVYMAEEQKKELENRLMNMTEEEQEAFAAQQEEALAPNMPSNIYQNYEEKASENKSSAVSFLIIGVLGIIFVALSWYGMLPFSIGGRGNVFSHGVMFAMFVLFVVIGIVSARNVGKYKDMIGKETDSRTAVEQLLTEQFDFDTLSAVMAETEEEAYFKRMELMRAQVVEAFPELAKQGSFVEALLDSHYDSIFG